MWQGKAYLDWREAGHHCGLARHREGRGDQRLAADQGAGHCYHKHWPEQGLRDGCKVGPRKVGGDRRQVCGLPKVDKQQAGVHQAQRGDLQMPARHSSDRFPAIKRRREPVTATGNALVRCHHSHPRHCLGLLYEAWAMAPL